MFKLAWPRLTLQGTSGQVTIGKMDFGKMGSWGIAKFLLTEN
jgi:hypothetical protein